jgi:hypothetical protein
MARVCTASNIHQLHMKNPDTTSSTNTSIPMHRARGVAFPRTIMANINNNNYTAALRECRASWVSGRTQDRLQALRSVSVALGGDLQRRHTNHTPPMLLKMSELASVVWVSAKV